MLRTRSRTAGFTLIELLVVTVVLTVAVMFGYPALQNFIMRSKLEGTARQIVTLMYSARLDAIKRGVPSVVAIDTTQQSVTGFTNVDDDAALKFEPDTGRDFRDTDYRLGLFELPKGVTFKSPAGGVVDSFSAVAWNATNVAVFEPDGSVRTIGAFRLGDVKDNFLEVRVEPQATARVFLRKWNGSAWLSQGEGGQAWQWN